MACGPEKYDFMIPDFHFLKCCQIHDSDYDKIILLGKRLVELRIKNSFDSTVKVFILNQIQDVLEFHQRVADKKFLYNMLNKNIQSSSGFKRKLYDFVAYTYYYAVKAKGIEVIMESVL